VNENDTINAIVEALRLDPDFGDAFAQPHAPAADTGPRPATVAPVVSGGVSPAPQPITPKPALEVIAGLSPTPPAERRAYPSVSPLPRPTWPLRTPTAPPVERPQAPQGIAAQRPALGLVTPRPAVPGPARGPAPVNAPGEARAVSSPGGPRTIEGVARTNEAFRPSGDRLPPMRPSPDHAATKPPLPGDRVAPAPELSVMRPQSLPTAAGLRPANVAATPTAHPGKFERPTLVPVKPVLESVVDEAKVIERRPLPTPSSPPSAGATDVSRTAASVSRLASIAAEAAAARTVMAPVAPSSAIAEKLALVSEKRTTSTTAPAKADSVVPLPQVQKPMPEVPVPETRDDVPDQTVEEKALANFNETAIALKRARVEAKQLMAASTRPAPKTIKRAQIAVRKAEAAWKEARTEVKNLVAERPAVAKRPSPALPVPHVIPSRIPLLETGALEKPLAPWKRGNWARLSFVAAVLIPVLALGLYYLFISSDQYRSEMRFAVRGTERSTLENLGLNAIPGATEQAGDAYIVIDYIHSTQILLDIQQKLGIDVRQFFSRPDIDFAYRIDPNMPLEKFIGYWRWMIDASYNSTTSITTFEVTAFNGEDAAAIANAVLKVSNELVNDLSTKARLQLITNAQSEVTRTEDRLVAARKAVNEFRNREQLTNPELNAGADLQIIQELETKLIDLKSRRASLLSTGAADSPSVRVLDRQIESYTTELNLKRSGIGTGADSSGPTNVTVANLLTQFNTLTLEQEFAEKAYTTALSSLETSQAEARRQDRYFAIAVEPNVPEIALHPLRMVNTMVAFFALCVVWLIGYLIAQAIRDHTI
jgi:capsular polysaccharide transport system permease protein